MERGEPLEFDDQFKDSCRLCPDGLDVFNETVYEFNGCKFHGFQKCYKQGQQLYNTTMERENICKASGYKIVSTCGSANVMKLTKHMSNTKK